jgi:hypothetical protein
MAHQKWEDQPNDPQNRKVTTLAHMILFERNYLGGAERLTSGQANADDDFWIHTIRGFGSDGVTGGAETWPLVDSAGNTDPEESKMVRMARVPYVVQSQGHAADSYRYLDHLLVGYTKVVSTLNPDPSKVGPWLGAAGASNLEKFGLFLTERLRPTDVTNVRALDGWNEQYHVGLKPFGWQEFAPPYDKRPKWTFRELEIKVDKALRIRLLVNVGATTQLRYLIVGYEGGAGW